MVASRKRKEQAERSNKQTDDGEKHFFGRTAVAEQRPKDTKEEFLGAHVASKRKREEGTEEKKKEDPRG